MATGAPAWDGAQGEHFFAQTVAAASAARRKRPHTWVPTQDPAVKRILVVDDDPDLRDIIALVLRRAGYVVEGAADGAEALDLMRRHRPDAVLLDLAMPVMDGRTFLEVKRGDPALAPVPVVIMSADVVTADALRLQYGVQGFLRKPFTVAAARAALGGVLQEPEEQAEADPAPLADLPT